MQLISRFVFNMLVFSLFIFAHADDPADLIKSGKAVYQEYCVACHGPDLKGSQAMSLVDGKWHYGATREAIIHNITEGIEGTAMIPWGMMLSETEIKAATAFVLDQANHPGTAMAVDQLKTERSIQTRDYKLTVQTFASGISIPWAMEWVSPDMALVTERPGGLRVIKDGTLLEKPVAGTPKVYHHGQGGLMDVAVDPHYAQNGWVYLAYSHQGERGSMTRLVRGRIKDLTWTDEQVLYEAKPQHYSNARHHYGSRIVFPPDGKLYFSIGERGAQKLAQDLSRPNGKIHRINYDGSIPDDNPFLKTAGALPSIFSYGHRNQQGLVVHPVSGTIWETEHGPKGGDELNTIRVGCNYGWPVITYGINYNGTPITDKTSMPGMEQPVIHWTPSIAVCGINVYTGHLMPEWRNHLVVTALKFQEVRIVKIEDDKVTDQEVILKNAGRVRDACTGPDGALYAVMNGPDRIIRIAPQ